MQQIENILTAVREKMQTSKTCSLATTIRYRLQSDALGDLIQLHALSSAQQLHLLQSPAFRLVLQKITIYALDQHPVHVVCVVCNGNGLELAKQPVKHPGWTGLHCSEHAQAFHAEVPEKHNCCEVNYHPDRDYWWRGKYVAG